MDELQRSMATLINGNGKDWPVNADDYYFKNVIGKGATAVVYEALCRKRRRLFRNRRKLCAIKCVKLLKEENRMEVEEEIKVLKSCNHENIIKHYTSFQVNNEMWLITKLYQGGSLLEIINNKKLKKICLYGLFNEVTIATVLKEVLKGLEYLHNKGIIHRDIKAGNILIGEDGSIQIADFGLSMWIITQEDRLKTSNETVGTPCWMAPEMIRNRNGYDFSVDVWGLGKLALFMDTGTVRFNFGSNETKNLIVNSDAPTTDTVSAKKYRRYGKSIRKVIDDCLQKDPRKRPTATQLLKYPIFKKAKDKRYLSKHLLKYLDSS